jgi:hypothetical protein
MGAYDCFILSCFEYCQIWLNNLMDDCHLRKITKLKEKRKKRLLAYLSTLSPESCQFGIKKVSLLFSHFPRGKNTHENAQHQLCRIGLLINNKIGQEIFL